MNWDSWVQSLQRDQPDGSWHLALQALWWEQRGNWQCAHQLCQQAESREGDWVHAYLHRVEGDLDNAAYWYARAGKPVCQTSLEEECRSLVRAMMDAAPRR